MSCAERFFVSGADNPTYLKNDKSDVIIFGLGIFLAGSTLFQSLRGLYIMANGVGKYEN